MNEKLRPNDAEKELLNLAYPRFFTLFDEIMEDSFWEQDKQFRFSRAKDGFAIYTELLNYLPIQGVLEHMKKARPPMEAEIGKELFKFIRNVIIHFPFFDSWTDVWISRPLVNWHKKGQSIDRFLKKYQGKPSVKYRFWDARKKRMTYLSIGFPDNYEEDKRIYLKDMLSEKEGVMFSFILMKKILDTQVE